VKNSQKRGAKPSLGGDSSPSEAWKLSKLHLTRRQALTAGAVGVATSFISPWKLMTSLGATALAQNVMPSRWMQLRLPNAPASRAGASLAFDPVGQRMLLFGGTNIIRGGTGPFHTQAIARINKHLGALQAAAATRTSGIKPGGAATNDMFEFDGLKWKSVTSTSGLQPAPRAYAHMTLDSHRQMLLLFGGVDDHERPLADMWAWDVVNASWTPVKPTALPPARSRGGMIYDELTDRVVLFGGLGENGFLADTWEWDGSAWFRGQASGPSARLSPSFAHIAGTSTSLLYGGFDGDAKSDTWLYSRSEWTEVPTRLSPNARSGAILAYDNLAGGLMLFGGGWSSMTDELDDTWIWSASSGQWSRQVTPVHPHQRGNAAAASYGDARGILVFGGETNNAYSDDSWLGDTAGSSAFPSGLA
jgi:hypothetical protein